MAQFADLVRTGDFIEARRALSLIPASSRSTIQSALLNAAVAETPREALGHITAALDYAPTDAGLLRAISNANAWLNSRMTRQAFAGTSAGDALGARARPHVDVTQIARQVGAAPPRSLDAPGQPEAPPQPAPPETRSDPVESAPATPDQIARAVPDVPATESAVPDVPATESAPPDKPPAESAGDDIDSLIARARTFDQEDNRAAAIELLRELRERRPDDANAIANLGFLLAEAGEASEARRCLESALRLDPNLTAARVALAASLEESGVFAAAAGEWQTLSIRDPENRSYRLAYARCIAAAGHYSDALVMLDELDDRSEVMHSTLLALGRIALQKRKGEDAYEIFRRLLQGWPEETAGYVGAGKALALMGRDRDAEVAGQLALGVDPSDAEALEIVNSGDSENRSAAAGR